MTTNWTIDGRLELAGDSSRHSAPGLQRGLLVLVAILLGFLPARTASSQPDDSTLASILKNGLSGIQANEFWRALRQGPGSSFQLGPEPQGWPSPQIGSMGSGWRNLQLVQDKTRPDGPQVRIRRMVYENGKGLRVTRVFTFYPRFQAAEYKTDFENVGSEDLPPLSRVFPLDLWFPFSTFERLVVYTAGMGDSVPYVYPITNWTVRKNYVLKDSGSGEPYSEWPMATGTELGEAGAHRPIALLEDAGSRDGIFLELGWAGYWQITFRWADFKKLPFPIPPTWAAENSDTLQIFGGMPGINIRLHPGEKISSPAVLLGFYKGGVRQGSNQLRCLKREYFHLPWPKEVPQPPTIFDYYYSSRARVPEGELRQLADRAAELGIEYFFVCADWVPEMRMWGPYEQYGSPGEPWSFPVDPEIFPSRTLRPLSDYVHSKGMKFGVWFDPEHAYDHWPVVQEHPKWFMPTPTGARSRTSYSSYVVNIGNPEALKWLENQMARAIREWNVDFIFHDRFVSPERFWSEFDPPDQKGITQTKYVEGRWELWRWLSAQFPGLLILKPGGPDFMTMQATHLTMAGHQPGDGNQSRSSLSGLNWFYPTVYVQHDFLKYQDSYSEPYPLSAWLSRFGAMLGIGDPIGLWSPAVVAQGKQVIEVYKSIRHLLKGDFYPLFPQTQTPETWDGWQFHDPVSGEGFAVVFRLRYCEQPTATIRLQGLREAVSYRFKDPFSGGQFTHTGRELIGNGLPVSLPKNGAQLLHYIPLGNRPTR